MPNADITEYFAKSQYNNLWLAIADNRLEDAIKEMDVHKVKGAAMLNLFTKGNPVIKATSTVLSSKKLNDFSYRRLFINEDDIKEFNELIRLLIAVHLNGHFVANEKYLLTGIVEILDYLVIDIRDGAGGYPNNPISGNIWFSGELIRMCCDSLAYYCDLPGDLESKIKVLENKCCITLSIMSHYPHLVGPDMVAAAQAHEAAGNFPRAKQMYSAVVTDLQWVADDIENFDKEDIKCMHIYSLEALASSYKRLMAMDKEEAFVGQLNHVERLIQEIKTTA